MPLNSGSPIIGRFLQGRIGILVVDLGFAGGGIDRLSQPDDDAANSAAAFADAHPGVAGLGQPDAGRLTAGLRMRGRSAQQRRQRSP